MQGQSRKIIHADMDAFYASVEIRENPSLKGKPVVVGGSPDSRGVVCAASYEARKFGVRSAIPCSVAKRLCPSAVFLYPNFPLYKSVSDQIRGIFLEYTDLVEPLSLDEAYLDVTENKISETSATRIAEAIKKNVREQVGLTVSCGVSYNKFLAKIASDWKKPDGLFVIRPQEASGFLENLPIGKFYGVGKVTEAKMKSLGVHTGRDLLGLSKLEMVGHFGKAGSFYYEIVRGIDRRRVNPHHERKSVAIEDTFSRDTAIQAELLDRIRELADGLAGRIQKNSAQGRSLTVKIKYSDFLLKTKTITLPHWIVAGEEIQKLGSELFLQAWDGKTPVRLLGLSLSNLNREEGEDSQLRLF